MVRRHIRYGSLLRENPVARLGLQNLEYSGEALPKPQEFFSHMDQ